MATCEAFAVEVEISGLPRHWIEEWQERLDSGSEKDLEIISKHLDSLGYFDHQISAEGLDSLYRITGNAGTRYCFGSIQIDG
ncbi:unnamed protein product, partial [marine sediment metagenome]